MMKSRAEAILDTVDDLIAGFLYYDRKEDEDLPRGEIEAAVRAGELTIDQMVQRFAAALKDGLQE